MFGFRRGINEVIDILLAIHHDVHHILALMKPKPLTTAIAVQFTGATIMDNNVLVFNVGQTSQASIMPLDKDKNPSGGTLSNVQYSFADPSATVILNDDGVTATVTGMKESNGPIGGTAECSVTDTNGVVSKWSQDFTIETKAVSQQITQSIAVQFSEPV